jgi:hypothetical protein
MRLSWNTAPAHFANQARTSLTSSPKSCVQSNCLLGITKLTSTIRYLGAEMEEALAIAEDIEI